MVTMSMLTGCGEQSRNSSSFSTKSEKAEEKKNETKDSMSVVNREKEETTSKNVDVQSSEKEEGYGLDSMYDELVNGKDYCLSNSQSVTTDTIKIDGNNYYVKIDDNGNTYAMIKIYDMNTVHKVIEYENEYYPVIYLLDLCFEESYTNFVIPDGIIFIDEIAGAEHDNLALVESLIFSDSVKYIGASGFAGCPNLKTISFGKNIEYLAENAFAGNPNLETVEFPSDCKLEVLKRSVFNGCKNLKFTMPDSLKYVFIEALRDVPYENITFNNNIICINLEQDYSNVDEIIIPDSVKYYTYGYPTSDQKYIYRGITYNDEASFREAFNSIDGNQSLYEVEPEDEFMDSFHEWEEKKFDRYFTY